MKAVVLRDGRALVLEDRPKPATAPGEVLVRSRNCGICGSDLHSTSLPDIFAPNIVMGHEFAGEVVDVGKGVDVWEPGDRVAINPNGDTCGTCRECHAGRFNLCRTVLERCVGAQRDGGMATYVNVPEKALHRVPDGVSMLQAAWVEPLAIALRVVNGSGISEGGTAMVLGAGPIGLLTLQALRRVGAREITVVEPFPFRRQMAERLGADHIVDPASDDPIALFGRDLEPPEYVFECAGIPRGIAISLAVVQPKGCVSVVGISPKPLELSVDELIFKEVVVKGSFIYVEEFPLAIRLLEQGEIDVESMTSDVLPLESFQSGFTRLGNAEDAIKIQLQP